MLCVFFSLLLFITCLLFVSFVYAIVVAVLEYAYLRSDTDNTEQIC